MDRRGKDWRDKSMQAWQTGLGRPWLGRLGCDRRGMQWLCTAGMATLVGDGNVGDRRGEAGTEGCDKARCAMSL